MNKAIKLILPLCLLAACSQKRDPVKYAEDKDNGLRKEISVGNMHYTIQYKPADYIVASEHPDSGKVAERLSQLKGMVWFNISFQVEGFGQSPLRYRISGLDEYTARQDYFLNKAPNDLYLLYGKDSLTVNSYWFENNQNLTPYETMVVGFKLPGNLSEPEQDLRLSYYDRIFKNGIIKTVIKKEDF
jgi:hypothetical protein